MTWMEIAQYTFRFFVQNVFIVGELQKEGYRIPRGKRSVKRLFRMSMIPLATIVIGIHIPSEGWNFCLQCLCTATILLFVGKNGKKIKATNRLEITYLCENIPIIALYIVTEIYCKNEIIKRMIGEIFSAILPIFAIGTAAAVGLFFERKNKKFIAKQSEKIKKAKTKIIAITGSFGKTSCKNILCEMLSEKYETVCTEGNYNTPMGIAKTVEKTSGEEDFLIAEFGARRKGDIALLCEYFPPEYGMITGVCDQHGETMGALHEIAEEKYTLARKVEKECVFGNNLYARRMAKRKGEDAVGKNTVWVENVMNSVGKTRFLLHIYGKEYPCETALLGEHNAENIALCALLALKLGVPEEKIVAKIPRLKPIRHRLEYSYRNGIHILDDGYNGNEVGIAKAAEVFGCYPSPRVAVAQGIVEYGRGEKEKNFEIGRLTAQVGDIIIVSGPNAKELEKGARAEGFRGRIIRCENMKKVTEKLKEIMKEGMSVWFQNDIPKNGY